jgi:predicted GIY-YIG superfamily endonuclease
MGTVKISVIQLAGLLEWDEARCFGHDLHKRMSHIVYCLCNVGGSPRRTYVGYTTYLRKRLRQHNGEIAGGAKLTRGGRWEAIFCVTGFLDGESALSC